MFRKNLRQMERKELELTKPQRYRNLHTDRVDPKLV
jgi:hypothetical protein